MQLSRKRSRSRSSVLSDGLMGGRLFRGDRAVGPLSSHF